MNKTAKIILALGIIYAVAVFAVFPKWTVDDAYITLRYANNLAEHSELTWNVGNDPIEGYTGVALPVILAGFIKLGISPVLTGQAIGVVSYFAAAILLYLLLKQISVRPIIRAATMAFYFTFPFLFANALGGLEGLLFIFSISLSLFSFYRVLASPTVKSSILLALALLFASLVRPEGVVLAVTIIIIHLIKAAKEKNNSTIKTLFTYLLIYALPAALYFLWRFNYYGQFLPNTFYVKSGGGVHLNHLKDLTHFLLVYLSAPTAIALTLLVLNPDDIWQKIKNGSLLPNFNKLKNLFYVAAVYIAVIMLQFTVTSLKMNFSFRFFAPFLPFILLFLAVCSEQGAHILVGTKMSRPLRFKMVIAILAVLVGYQALMVTHRLKDEIRFARGYKSLIESQHIKAAKYVKESVPSNTLLAVLYDAGALPYFTGLKTIDMGGLNDENITKYKMGIEEKREYFFAQNPGVAVLTSTKKDVLTHSADTNAIVEDKRFENYTLVKKFDLPSTAKPPVYEFVYFRNDLVIGDKVK